MGIIRTLCDGLLVGNDRFSMGHSLEVRMLFLDNAVVDFARRLRAFQLWWNPFFEDGAGFAR